MAYANYGIAQGGGVPGAGLVAPYLPSTIVAAIACNGFILLLTPAGSLPSPRWRWWAGVTAATPAVMVLVVTLSGPAGGPVRRADSPLDLGVLDGRLRAAYQVAFLVTILANVLATVSLVVRFRRARGVERQQLRWVVLGTVVAGCLSLVHAGFMALGAFNLAPLGGGLNPPILAATIGAAILRYRLYDLDRIISRTVAWWLLTVLLGGGYAAAVLVLGQLFGTGERTPAGPCPGPTRRRRRAPGRPSPPRRG